MKIEDIEIHVGKVDFPYTPVRKLEAKCEATMAFSPAPTIDEMNAKLREMASKVGANAVIDVQYNSGVSMTSWKSMKGTGLAVKRESDDVACPSCAETIKRAATKCRFCGEVLTTQDAEAPEPAPTQPAALAVPPPPTPKEHQIPSEPMRETNNPQMWMIAGIAVFVILMLIGMAG